METKKLTEGGLLASLLIVIGIVMMLSGVGYWLYLDLIAPIIMALIDLRSGKKVSMIVAFSVICITFLIQGDLVAMLYLIQAFAFGLLCSCLLQYKFGLMEDLMLSSIMGCLLMLGLDRLLVMLTGVSLLDEVPIEVATFLSKEQLEVFYYIMIAATPVASMLFVYIGSLLLGNRLRLLKKSQEEKYKQVRYYMHLSPWIYCSSKTVIISVLGVIITSFIAMCLEKGYLKALFVCFAVSLLYFLLQDLMKLIVNYGYQVFGKYRILIPFIHLGMFVALFTHFIVTSVVLVLLGSIIDYKTKMRQQKSKQLKWYLVHHPKIVS